MLSTELVLSGRYDTGTWDLHPDGDRMVIAVTDEMVGQGGEGEATEPVFTAVVNWFTEMRAALGETAAEAEPMGKGPYPVGSTNMEVAPEYTDIGDEAMHRIQAERAKLSLAHAS